MIRLYTFRQFVNESKTNVQTEISAEINSLTTALCTIGAEQVDYGYVEMDVPGMMRIGLALYPELLSYSDRTEPWICVQLELDADRCPWWDGKEDENKTAELLSHLVERLKSVGHTPFKDEDAFREHWARDKSVEAGGNWQHVKYKCYVNPSYPEGQWENHTIG